MQSNWKNREKDILGSHKLTVLWCSIYMISLLWITLFKLGVRFAYMENRIVHLVPFTGSEIDSSEIMLNVFIFVPLGIYTGLLYKKWSIGTSVLFFFLFSLLIEGLQYFLKAGAFDSTDIMTNTTGGMVGIFILRLIEYLFKRTSKAQKFINILASIATVLVILFLFLLKTNHLWIRYQ